MRFNVITNDMSDNELHSGWISIYRSIRNHWIWHDPMKFQRWIDLLLEVNHIGRKVNIGNVIIECERGQTVRSLGNWAIRWKCSKSSARRFLELLEKDQMIVSENVSRTTRITVCNYNDYQILRNNNKTMVDPSRNDGESIAKPNNNDNNLNNENMGEKPYPVSKEDSKEKLTKKEVEFKESIEPYVERYGKGVCNNFYLYWSEPNKSKTKLRYEMEKTWDVSRRLANWANRDNSFNTKSNGTGAEPHYQKL